MRCAVLLVDVVGVGRLVVQLGADQPRAGEGRVLLTSSWFRFTILICVGQRPVINRDRELSINN